MGDRAHENIKIRKRPRLNSTALGILPAGSRPTWATCHVVHGEAYSLCEWRRYGPDHRWAHIRYRSVVGYVPFGCIV
ncbi:hypothetical protein ACWCQL_30115 [Streptomyces sp. NPDC002073]